MSKKYWPNRLAQQQYNLTSKSIADTEKQLRKYYINTSNSLIKSFTDTYNKVLTDTIINGRNATPADLYKLSDYWELQNQIKEELQKLGDKSQALLIDKFEKQYNSIYSSFRGNPDLKFAKINKGIAKQAINQVWTADGKQWSQRVWNNTDHLAQTLNDKLVSTVISGKKPTELKKELMTRFNVSYNQSDNLVRTEMAHIQTQASIQSYKDNGIEYFEFCADPDESTCDECTSLDGQKFKLSDMVTGENAPPVHCSCRCCVIPFIDDSDNKD